MNHSTTLSPHVLSLLRIISGYLFIWHGISKVTAENFHLASLTGAAATIELVAGALIVLGLFTRLAAFIASGEMAFAYFMAHAAKGAVLTPIFNGGDGAVLFCFLFFSLVFAGPGPWSIDHLRRRA
jgi:putative oxidoreductase